MRRIGPFLVEKDLVVPAGRLLAVSSAALLMAFFAAGLVFWAYGTSPVLAYRTIFVETLLSPSGFAEGVRRAIPLLLAGVGLVLAFRGQFWNIGAEGQLLLGAVAAAGVALFAPVPAALKLPAMFLAGFAAGGLWAAVPALLKLRLGVNDVLTTLMLNYVAVYLVEWLIHGPWRGRTAFGFAYTDRFPEAAMLPLIPGTYVHWPTLALALLLAGAAWFVLARTAWGYPVRVTGDNPEAARYAHMPVFWVVFGVALASGGLAGLAGVGEVAGVHGRLLGAYQISLGYGYTAIIVAWLARGNPLGAVLTALFMGLVFASGDVMKVALQMPFRVTDVFNGLILFFLISTERLLYYRVRWAPERKER
ncbi:MAG TPA: ABC transporter permease [Oceanithermus profundus]|uniref:ABC transporter permease n=1 Tax=Oceanithermus profundus TaxID=187137 RepID=A0A7C4VJZ4_9DEIN|nr:ABC transporter permease [Oceanithermus profundus]